MVDGRMVE